MCLRKQKEKGTSLPLILLRVCGGVSTVSRVSSSLTLALWFVVETSSRRERGRGGSVHPQTCARLTNFGKTSWLAVCLCLSFSCAPSFCQFFFLLLFPCGPTELNTDSRLCFVKLKCLMQTLIHLKS